MAIQSVNTLKGWFETLDKPTQAHFWDWLDSFFHKSESIPQASVTDLVTTLNSLLPKSTFDAYEQGQLIVVEANYTYAIPAGYLLEKIIPYYGAGGTMKLSKVAYGDEDVMPDTEVAVGWNNPIDVNILAVADAVNVYIDGIPAGSKINFIKRKIKMI